MGSVLRAVRIPSFMAVKRFILVVEPSTAGGSTATEDKSLCSGCAIVGTVLARPRPLHATEASLCDDLEEIMVVETLFLFVSMSSGRQVKNERESRGRDTICRPKLPLIALARSSTTPVYLFY